MKVVKITRRSSEPSSDGYWLVFAMVHINGNYQYGVFTFDTEKEAYALNEGDVVDIEKVRFCRRTPQP